MSEYVRLTLRKISDHKPRLYGKMLKETLYRELYKQLNINDIIKTINEINWDEINTYFKPKLNKSDYEKYKQWKQNIAELKDIPHSILLPVIVKLADQNNMIKLIDFKQTKNTSANKNVTVKTKNNKPIDKEKVRSTVSILDFVSVSKSTNIEKDINDDENTEFRKKEEISDENKNKENSYKLNTYVEQRLNSLSHEITDLRYMIKSLQDEIRTLRAELSKLQTDYEIFKDDVLRLLNILSK